LRLAFDNFESHVKNSNALIALPLLRCQWRRPNFIKEFSGYFEKFHFPADKVVFKINQKDLLVASDEEAVHLFELSKMGVLFMISHFSSEFLLLKKFSHLPIKYLEIDDYYTATLKSLEDNATFLRMTIDLAKNFDIKLLVSEVSTKAQMVLLKDIGFLYMKGRLWADEEFKGKNEGSS